MSVVAMSDTAGSLGVEIGRAVAAGLDYAFADREIITEAAERFGQDARALTHIVEERPTLREHFEVGTRRYAAFVEATILEMAARDDVVLVGRACPFVLGEAPHTLRVRIDAPERLRAERIARSPGITPQAALDRVRESDRGRSARTKLLFHADWGDPLRYDLLLSTERLDVDDGARAVIQALAAERFRSTEASRRTMTDRALASQVHARLFANAVTRDRPLEVTCAGGVVTLAGAVDAAQLWVTAEEVAAAIPGVAAVRNEITVIGVALDTRSEGDELSHAAFLHGEGRSWGGYGGEWYEREWDAVRRYRDARRGQAQESPEPARRTS
ncbi:MAG: cytidylate kinase family protein [Candidatus Rokubacteria bacterium]|nr:cytidylate kinase family protein [Candidatus Rokubacteria bacterium]